MTDLQQHLDLIDKFKDWKENRVNDLLAGLVLISNFGNHDVSIEKCRIEINEISSFISIECKQSSDIMDVIKAINHVLFEKLKFVPVTQQDFYKSSNSMINLILEYKSGNSYSLSIIYLLICQKLKLPIYGLNFPNFFILTCESQHSKFNINTTPITVNEQIFINPFNKGIILGRKHIDDFLVQLEITQNPTFLKPCTNFDIVIRGLRNLKLAFDKEDSLNNTKSKQIENIIVSII